MATCLNLIFVLNVFTLFSPIISEYFIDYQTPRSCKRDSNKFDEYFDVSQLKCRPCSQSNVRQTVSSDGFSCICKPGYRYSTNFGPATVTCEPCGVNQTTSEDGWSCVHCDNRTLLPNRKCSACGANNITVERELNGSWVKNSQTQIVKQCQQCEERTIVNSAKNRCVRCTQILSMIPTATNCVCPESNKIGNVCFRNSTDVKSNILITIPSQNGESDSKFFSDNLGVSFGLCQSKYGNLTACQALGNMCVLLYYNFEGRRQDSKNQACNLFRELSRLMKAPDNEKPQISDWPYNMPWLYYSGLAKNILNYEELPIGFTVNPPMQLKFIVAQYSLDGRFLGMANVTGGLLQLCKMSEERMNAVWSFGTTYKSTCNLRLLDLFDTVKYPLIFYDLFLEYTANGKSYLYAIPVLVENYLGKSDKNMNKGNMEDWVLTRRFFLVDNIATRKVVNVDENNQDISGYVRYAKSLTMIIKLQPNKNGRIFSPYLRILYGEMSVADSSPNKKVQVTFQSEYIQDQTDIQKSIEIAFGTLSAFGILLAGFNTWVWSKRAGRIAIDFVTLVNFFLNLCASLGNVFFITTLGIGLYFLLFFKGQDAVMLLPLSGSLLAEKYISFIVITFVFKLFHVVKLLVHQCTMDIFFIDWERPSSNQKDMPVSVWRTFFVANEWNEIQTTRKICGVFQLLMVLFFLVVVGFENIATNDGSTSLTRQDTDSVIAHNLMFRYTLSTTIYLIVGFCQWLYMLAFYERFIEDKVQQFVDLCSISNISVFIMDHLLYGYYIHGRSVHGKADTNLHGIQEMMSREQDDLCSQRGLLPNTEQQTFQMSLPNSLRCKYMQIMMPITFQQPSQANNRMESGNSGNNEVLIHAHETMNNYLSAFIDHSLKDADYIVKDKTFLENVVDAEFMDTTTQGIFYNDNGHSFDQVLFYGSDMVLLQFDILLFNIVDLIWKNFILAAVLTYIVSKLISLIRHGGSKKNLARKTLIDKRFLI